MDKYETFETVMADAQYLREFYDWNKARHPEWDGTYVLEIAKKKEERARYIKYEVPIEEYWMKLRDLLRGWWEAYRESHPYTGIFKEDRIEYCAEFLKSLPELNPAMQFFGQKKAEWFHASERYAIFIIPQSDACELYLCSSVYYDDKEQGKMHHYNTGHSDEESLIGIISKEVKNA